MIRKAFFAGVMGLMLFAPHRVFAHGLVHIDYVNNQVYIQAAPGPDDYGLIFWDPNEGPYIQFDTASDGIMNVANISAGGHLVVGDQISLQILGPLLYDAGNGSGVTSAGSASVSVTPANQIITSSSGMMPAFPFTTVQADGYVHEHLFFYFSNEVAGAYGLEFRVLTSNPSIAPSQPYFLLFDNGLSETQMANVVNDFESVLLPGDLNHDGFVGQADLNVLLGEWGQKVAPGTKGDTDKDGFIGQGDLNTILSEWGKGVNPSAPDITTSASFTAVPESSSLVLTSLIGLGCLFVWRRKRKVSLVPRSS